MRMFGGSKTFESGAVANMLLKLGRDEGVPITPLKLQKLVYYCHAWFLVLHKRPLLSEPIEAWQFGPVIPSLYSQFREYGSSPIDTYAISIEVASGGTFTITATPEPDDKDAQNVIKEVWTKYKGFSASQLSSMTHRNGSPWHQVWTSGGGAPGLVISNDLIRDLTGK